MTMPNAAQVHLTLNHLPVILPPVGAAILAFGLWLRSMDLKKAGLLLLVIAGLLAIPTYLTGEPSETLLKNYPNVSRTAMHEHEDSATQSLVLLEVACAGALLAFIQLTRSKFLSKYLWIPVMVLIAVACGMLLKTAHLGGIIRHEEIQTPEERDRFDAGLGASGFK